ncbi:MAG: major facilitator superfamily 1 [Firmicutes bacterium]|nr:major facilitator superfamily 1 [Bacillota bacterium]
MTALYWGEQNKAEMDDDVYMNYNFSMEKIVLIIVMVTSFLTPFSASAITIALPTIGAEFKAGPVLLSWVIGVFLLVTAACLLPLGRLADIVGRKKVFALGVVLFTISSLMSGFSWSMMTLILFRVGQGIASAMIFSTGMAIVSLVYPAETRGKAMGFIAAAVYIGLSLGPVLGGILNYYVGWRSIFYFTALLSGFVSLLTIWRLKGEWISNKGEKFDKLGSLGYMIALVSILYGLSEITRATWAKYVMVVGVCLLLVFLYYQWKQDCPIFPVRLFWSNQVFAFSNLAAMINYSATFAISFLLSLYLQVIMGYDSQISGVILLVQPLVMAFISPFAGSLSDRIEPAIVSSCGMAVSTVGLAYFIFITPKTSIWMIIADLALIGLGFALFSSPNNNAIMGSVEKKYLGAAASALGTMRLIGQALSMAIVTLLLSGNSGSNAGMGFTEQLVQDFHLAFIIFTIICGIGVLPSLVRGKVKSVG